MTSTLENKIILVTGCAGFIGSALSEALLSLRAQVVGLDNLNNYYPVDYKTARLSRLEKYENFTFHCIDLSNQNLLYTFLANQQLDYIVHLAAQAGVRYSLENPQSYIQNNILAFVNLIEACKNQQIKHLVFASSSSVYGNNKKLPYSPHDKVDNPVSLYAASKKSQEMVANVYSHLYQMPLTGLRYFTVYGPWGRPDMAPIKFANRIMSGEPIEVYHHGQHERDFTYIDDIVTGTLQVLLNPPTEANAFYRILNIGYGQPIRLLEFIELLGNALGKPVKMQFTTKQLGDVDKTWADIQDLQRITGYKPIVPIKTGIKQFANWFKQNRHYFS